MLKDIFFQLRLMVRRKSFQFSFIFMLLVCIFSPFYYAYTYKDTSEFNMPSASNMFIGNSDSSMWVIVGLLLPIIAVFPYGYAYFNDGINNSRCLYHARITKRNYYVSQCLSAAIGGFIIICIPFIVNIVLNMIIFGENGYDVFTLNTKFDWNYCANITGDNVAAKVYNSGFIMKGTYINHPEIYNLLHVLLASMLSGLLCAFSYVTSFYIRGARIFFLLPSFFIVEFFKIISSVSYGTWSESSAYVNLDLLSYISTAGFSPGTNYVFFYVTEVILLMYIAISLHIKIKKEDI